MLNLQQIVKIILILGLCFAEFNNILFFINVPEFFPGQIYFDIFLIISLFKIILNVTFDYKIKYFSKRILLVGAFLNLSILFLTVLSIYLGNKNVSLFNYQWVFDLLSFISLLYVTMKYKNLFGYTYKLLLKNTASTLLMIGLTFIFVEVI